jgi:endo-alpha-N-acetylgalactosaminidase
MHVTLIFHNKTAPIMEFKLMKHHKHTSKPFMHSRLAIVLLAAAFFLPASPAHGVELRAGKLTVEMDTTFPRVIRYKTDQGALDGQPAPVNAVQLNGQPASCRVTFRQINASAAEYRLIFSDAAIDITLCVTVSENAVELRVTAIKENGSTKLKSFAFPGNALLTLGPAQADAAIATAYGEGYGKLRESLGQLATLKPVTETANYAFVSAGKLAAGIASNHIDDHQRVSYQITGSDGKMTFAAANPLWQYREIDTATLPLQWVKVLITGDRNGDGIANWQDAALVQRAMMPKPLGSDSVRSCVGENIAMNFASGAQQPFLRILDEIKKCSLATDGLGQKVTIKGFSSEGHDSANTDYAGHWNDRAGGLRDLNFLLDQARRYNARVGIHINVTEAYPEAHRYLPDTILQRDANGNLCGGWYWLDSSHLIDKRKDLLTGSLFKSLDQMRADLPKLDFVYVDVYGDHGWNSWMLGGKFTALKLPIHTEYSTVFDPLSTWSHWRVGGSVMRFLWYSDRDLFDNDPILRGGRGEDDTFMAWQSQHNFHHYIRNTFIRHLPVKYLKHFDLLRWEPGKEAVFSDGVHVVKSGDNVSVTQNGRLVMTWTGGGSNNQLFVPWGEKIYVWSDAGNEATWDLPPAWKDCREVFLYQLTSQGRTSESRLAVNAGKVTLKVDKGVPYVLYQKPAPAQQPLVWGEGSLVKDPGFESHGLTSWPATGKARIEDDPNGNARLILTGNVSQQLTGLKPGQTYAATVWALTTGNGPASIAVETGGRVFSNEVTRCNVRHSAPCDPRNGTNYQRLRVVFDVPAGVTTAKLALKAVGGAEFDDVRVVATRRSPEAAKHWFWEDFESVETGGYGPFTCCADENTHLSEANPPHTKDTLNGRFSLKTRGKNGRIVRTLPSTIRFKPNTRYRLTCQTLGDGHFVVESDGKTVANMKFSNSQRQVTGEFVTTGDTESFLTLFKDGGDALVIDDLAIDDLGHSDAPTIIAAVEEKLPGHRVLLDEDFKKPLASHWRKFTAKQSNTSVATADQGLAIQVAANVSAGIERDLPTGTDAVECRLDGAGDTAQTWGVGLCLLWKGGPVLRVNLRVPDGAFGIDSTAAAQKIAGKLLLNDPVTLRLRLEPDKALVEARNGSDDWQTLETFPREKFPGSPDRLRIGKMHGVEGIDDNPDPGGAAKAVIRSVRIYGR